MPKRIGTDTSRELLVVELYRGETFWCRNILLPKCFGVVLLSYSFDHHCTIIQKEHGGGAKQEVKLCNTVLAFTHSQNQSIKKQTA